MCRWHTACAPGTFRDGNITLPFGVRASLEVRSDRGKLKNWRAATRSSFFALRKGQSNSGKGISDL